MVSRKPRYHELREGQGFRLDLSVEGDPTPAARWFRNGYELVGVRDTVFVISSLNSSHSGTYSCELRNIAGSHLWLEATLRVLPSPATSSAASYSNDKDFEDDND